MPSVDLNATVKNSQPLSAGVRAWFTRLHRNVATWLLLVLFATGTVGSFWNLHQREQRLFREYPLQGTALQALSLQELRKLYSEEVVDRVRPYGIEAAHDYDRRDHAIPLPATLTMELGKRLSVARPGSAIRLYSDYPFPWRKDGGPRDDFEREALIALQRQPEQPFYRFEEFDGRPSLRYAVADRLQASCVGCHNNHPDSPKRDWQVGDVRGVLEIIRPLDEEVSKGQTARQRDMFVTLTMAGLGLAGLGFMYFRLQRTAASLGRSESRTRAIVEVALDSIITIDQEGTVLEFNPAAEKTFGRLRQDVIGKRLSELIIPPASREAHERGLRHYLATGESRMLGKRVEVTALHVDGTEFPVELSIEVIRQAGPAVFTAYLCDLTERKRAEAALVERVRQATLTAELGVILTHRDSLQRTLQGCAEILVEHLDVAFARIWTLNEEENMLELQASAGLYTHLDGAHGRVPVGQFKIGQIAAQRQPHLTNAVVGDPRVGDQDWARREGMVAFAGYPLICHDRLVGVVAMFSRKILTEATMKAIEAASNGIAVGIEQCRISDMLRDSEEEFRTMFELASTSKAQVDPATGRFLRVNQKFCKMLGYSVKELLDLDVSQITHPEDREGYLESFRRLMRGEIDTLSAERRYLCKDGAVVWGLMTAGIICNAQGQPTRCTIVIQDVTSRIQAEQAAETNHRWTRLIVDTAFDPLVAMDSDGLIIDWNHQAEILFGWLRDEVLGRSLAETIIPARFQEEQKRGLKHFLATGEGPLLNKRIESYAVRRDGQEFPVEIAVSPVRLPAGYVFSAFLHDITNRKRMESELANRDKQLQQSQKLEAVGSLAGGIAHEFNNLLQAIRGYTRLAMEGLPIDGQPCQDLQQVDKAALRASTLTRQLLGFSRHQMLEAVALDPSTVVTDLVKMLRPLIGEDIDLELSLAADVGTLHADPGLLLQMLLNLCINARDAMPDGGRLVLKTDRADLSEKYCDLHPPTKPGSYVVFSVADTGCGMSPEVKDRIFEPFFTTKEVGRGTGLGLAMVYGTVQQHGGMVNVYSELEIGTTFKIYLPIATAAEPDAAEQPALPSRGGSETILIAEDESMVRELAVRILKRAGYSLLIAADGAEAIELLEAHADVISLALLDAVMPKRTGREVHEWIKRHKPGLPVVICSGYDPDTGQLKLLREKGLRLVQKPFDPEVLLHTVREVLDAEQICDTSPCLH